MQLLKEDLALALESLEEGEEERAHELIEEHLERAVRIHAAVERLENLMEEHIDHLDDLSNRTRDWDMASVRNTVDELRSSIDEDDRVEEAMDELEDVFVGSG